jgi:hypothetical protein
MNGSTILSTFETLRDETLDQGIELSLANQAKGELSTELRLQCDRKLDVSQTSVVNGTYTTSYTLVADILVPASHIIYVGTDQYTGVPFEHQILKKDDPYHWFVDLANMKFYLTGTQPQAQVITFPYVTTGTDIAADNNTVLKWPTFTHLLIPYQMAKIWFAIDQGDKERSWDDRWSSHFEQLKSALVAWDQQWKLANIGGSTPYGQDGSDYLENRININK